MNRFVTWAAFRPNVEQALQSESNSPAKSNFAAQASDFSRILNASGYTCAPAQLIQLTIELDA